MHAAFLRSDLARAAITRIDTSAAKELPGVVAVYTWEDFNGISGPGYHSMMSEELAVPPPLAITDVRYVGDPVAMVVAETRYLAEDACELIEVDYDPQTAVVDYTRAAADTENLVHAGWGLESNAMVQVPFTPLSPDLDEVFASAAHVVECDVEQNRYVAMPMETRGIVASFHKGRQELEIACATQSVHETKNFFARYVADPREQRARHRARRRRRLRPEDVRVPRGVRGRAGVVPPRATGEVDRGPSREPAVGRPLAQRVRAT